MHSVFFYIFASIMIISSLGVVLARNPLYNVLSLVVSIFALSSLFILMEAFFVGTILLLVYAGAVLVFFLFVVMCLNLTALSFTKDEHNHYKLLGGAAGLGFLGLMVLAVQSFLSAKTMGPTDIRGTIENIGMLLFTDYLLPFELTSLLLLIAIFGIVTLAQGAFKNNEEDSRTSHDRT